MRVAEDIRKRHSELASAARNHRFLYYGTRLVAGLAAGLLPFFLTNTNVATGLAAAVVVATVFDSVFNPKERWKSLTRSCHFLYIEDLIRNGEYEQFKKSLSLFMDAEEQRQFQDITSVIQRAEAAGNLPRNTGS